MLAHEGTTTLAINLAAGFAKAGRRVCLVDLALTADGVASALGLAAARGMAGLVPIAGVVDQAELAGIVTAHTSGFDVVLAAAALDAALKPLR